MHVLSSVTNKIILYLQKEAIKTAEQRSVWLEAGVDIGSIESVVSQSTVHTLASTVDSWTKDDKRKDETTLFCHYIICNDTNEAIRLGQVRNIYICIELF